MCVLNHSPTIFFCETVGKVRGRQAGLCSSLRKTVPQANKCQTRVKDKESTVSIKANIRGYSCLRVTSSLVLINLFDCMYIQNYVIDCLKESDL